ncbi:GGDEF domain-containing protein [Vibrio sinensis]|uniref:diguanylate cyclase n=1 Tax=Vibrio sinensis TaxID=2302434 RepID=A0A3A6QMR7_9VIBR|nr:GGDEF domain-containing protein [Vibrio sinensis]RJX69724.1 GGDEF domain-containing protein [Vibrio sinensis]
METLLKKISESGLDASSVSGEKALTFWHHIHQHVATTPQEKAQALIISSEYQAQLKQGSACIEELRTALSLLMLPQDAELILEVRHCLADRLVDFGEYGLALHEYIASSTIAVNNSFIDDYVLSVLGMGNLCDAYGDHTRALRYYQKIDGIDHAISSRSLRLRYKLYMLACYIELNQIALAEDLIKECEELSILVSDKVLSGQIMLYQAKIYRLKGKIGEAIRCLGGVQFAAGNIHSDWLSNMIRLELGCCLSLVGKLHIASWVLESARKKIIGKGNPMLHLRLCNALGSTSEKLGDYKAALKYNKQAFQVESSQMKKIPISELGASQLRRLSRFELQLKLILSEIENRELKETTEHQKHTVAQLQKDVFTDPLTGLRNRRWLDVKLKELLNHDIPFAFLVIDIDHFKSINDELSHLVGDKAIMNVAHELSDYFQFEGASCVRFGGEEFLVILEQSDIHQAKEYAEQYRERIYLFDWPQILGERGLTVSIGITLHREGENTQRTFYRADKALYRAKANGRNQVCCE